MRHEVGGSIDSCEQALLLIHSVDQMTTAVGNRDWGG
jgi:hypothetical protein